MDAEEKSVDEKIGQWLGTKFGAAHADLPDMDEWLGQAADYVNVKGSGWRKRTKQQWEKHQDDFPMHALTMALIHKQPDYLLAIIRKRSFLNASRPGLGCAAKLESKVVEVAIG
jgi:hypothetical protein